ncbi:transglycosylase SLT domain-containing protein [Bacteroidota bacterium]
MKKIKLNIEKFIIAFFAIIYLLLFISCGGENQNDNDRINDFDEIINRGRLIAVTEYNSTDYFIYRGEPMGYQFELLQMLADDLNMKLEVIVTNNLDKSFRLLERGESDIIAINLTVNKPRTKKYNFTNSFVQTRQVLVQRKPSDYKELAITSIEDSLLRNQLDLAGKKIHVQKESAYVHRLNNLSEEIGRDITIIEMDEIEDEQLIKMVADGEIDYTVCDEHVAKVAQRFYDNIDIETPVSFPQNLAWAVRKDANCLLDTINNWINTFKHTTEYALIYNKYFRNDKSSRIINSEYYANLSGKVSAYDEWIKEHSKTINWDWRLLASLIFQESRFKPNAVSWAGAYGLMQLMPRTGIHFGVDEKSSPDKQIEGGVKYIKWLDNRFSDQVKDESERIKFILAAYNAGYGHISDARRLAEKYGLDPNKWENNVDYFVLNKSNPKFYKDPDVYFGYCRGEETYKYVNSIIDRYEHYKNIISTE